MADTPYAVLRGGMISSVIILDPEATDVADYTNAIGAYAIVQLDSIDAARDGVDYPDEDGNLHHYEPFPGLMDNPQTSLADRLDAIEATTDWLVMVITDPGEEA